MSTAIPTTPADLPPTAYTIPEACRAAKISRSHLYRLLREDKLKVIRLGRSVRVTREELVRLVREGTG